MRAMVRKILISLTVLVGFAAALAIAVLLRLDLDSVLTARLRRLLPLAETRLGRSVTFDAVETTLGWGVFGEVSALRIAGTSPSEPPLLSVERTSIGIDLRAALLSLGKDVRVQEVVVRGLRLRLERDAEGRLSHQDVIDRLGSSEPSPPLSEEARSLLLGLHIDRFAVEDARVDVRDLATDGVPVEGAVSALHVTLSDVRLGEPLRAVARARVFSDEDNLRLELVTGPLSADPDRLDGPSLRSLRVRASALDLSRLAPYLGAALPVGIDQATVGGDIQVVTAEVGVAVTGEVALRSLVLTGGEPFDADLAGDVTVSPDRLLVRRFDARLAGMPISVSGDLRDLGGEPRLEGISVRAPELDAARLLAVLPPLRRALPPGSRLAGRVSLTASGAGGAQKQEIEAKLDLAGLDARIPGLLTKPRGVPCGAIAKGVVSPGSLRLDSFRLMLGPMALAGTGTVSLGRRSATDLRFDTKPFPLDGLARMLPAVADATPAGVTWDGTGSVRAHLKTDGDRLDAEASIHFTGARVEVPGLTLRGEWRAEASARGAADDLTAEVDLDLTAAGLSAEGRIDKPVGMPARVQASFHRTPARLDVVRAEVALGPVSASGSGALGPEGASVRVVVPRVDLAALARVLPPLREVFPGPGHVALTARVSGQPPDGLVLDVEKVALAVGRSRLTASGRARASARPTVELSADAPALYLDELFPPGKQAEGAAAAAPDLSPLRAFDARAKLTARRGSWDGEPFSNLVSEVALEGGELTLKTFQADAFGGRLVLDGTRLDARTDEPRLDVRARAKDIDVDALLSSRTSLKRYLTGRVSGTVEATGSGATWDALAPSLAGTLEGAVSNGRFLGFNAWGSTVAPLLSLLPKQYRRPGGVRLDALAGTTFSNLGGALRIRDGRLRIADDLVLATPQGPLHLGGDIGLDQSLDLSGRLDLPPEVVGRLTGGRYRPAAALPLRVKIGGTLRAPVFEALDVRAAGKALIAAVLSSAAAAEVEEALDRAREEAERRGRELKEQAEAEVRRRADELAKRADEERRRLEDKGRKEVEAARRRAEAEARRVAEQARKKAEEAARKKAEEAAKELRRRFGL